MFTRGYCQFSKTKRFKTKWRKVTPAVTLGPDTVDTASASEVSRDLSQTFLPSGLQLLRLAPLDDRLWIFDPDYAWLHRCWSFVSIPKEGRRFDHGPHNEKSGHDPQKTCLMIVEHNISYHTPL